ncbi:MAG: lysophospholipase [Bacteroidia bacterium]|nr:lysophospholipase [Bacteroidia bacterium]MCF8426531.1 lysophospholipase [Bacteroidia bacterium]
MLGSNRKRKLTKHLVIIFASVFILANVIAFFHAYKFTHFAPPNAIKTLEPQHQNLAQKLSSLFFGVNLPRPINTKLPSSKYEVVTLNSNKKIECWHIKANSSKGTILLFHGYGGQKSGMLDKAKVFEELGYSTFIVDFMGSGNSEGNQTTIGYFEAEQVKTCFDYLEKLGEKNCYLFGTSMGAVAILKAVSEYDIQPKGIILECPFGSMYKTVCARFKSMNIPTFSMASLLVFWGGMQNSFWAFNHNPSTYAKQVNCPTILMYGQQDIKVSREEIDAIYANLKGKKQLLLFPNAGHENYLNAYKKEWINGLNNFLSSTP